MKVFITSDHGGFELKAQLFKYLTEHAFDVEDLGPYEFDADDDYPFFANILAEKLIATDPQENKGIIICRSATGVSIVANRHPHIRAAVVWNETVAKHARQHNDSNVLCLSGDYVDAEQNLAIAKAWLEEPFSNEERHKRRIDMIDPAKEEDN
ncbi:RpiB/LacA/LacB family sugar-phosphate isomerase [Candidatus Saccharibacteria bacterium]|nr:RpiB/LacA/LacB family sugar-phosphate isomerase [Candidatus Saccharibacteria bacterium]